eukprot:TRINITY_DN65957_c11_g2_i1.p2 TRINITY_DN65957_c11_g2~~TRINITY_DN65957_c11_g2_i1.p2  ORF type:complete len:546 (+),score=296.86 TRINITY_DN65957_c11_g2_i1:186-1823(+)
MFSGQTMPALRKWMEDNAGLNVDDKTPPQPSMEIPAAIRNEAFEAAVKGHYKRMSFDDDERAFHGHGHTCQEIWELRYGKFPRVPDMVLYPGSHEDVEVIVKAAHELDVVIIPYGGGTSVTQALLCPENEKRTIVSLDMKQMAAIKWINHRSMMACIEAGAVGVDLERRLGQYGFCLGHQPDSSEFSTLGGWIATRASGMKKSEYGNIEDIVIKIRMVTPSGTVERKCNAWRQSTGPDINNMIIGSEGMLGVVTEAVVRVRSLPEVRRYGSLVFPDFESGVAFMHEVAMKRCAPACIRLVDNMQFQFGQALKPAVKSWKHAISDKIKKWYVTKHKGFDVEKMCAATMVYEGSHDRVTEQEKEINAIAQKYGGLSGGEENGMRGFMLTFAIALLRDLGVDYCFMAESFETSVPWDSVLELCHAVKEKIRQAARARGVTGTPFVSSRISQTYDTSACVYVYFGFIWKGLENPIQVFSEIEDEARKEILRLGGSLSHHHGVGKLRRHFMPEIITPPGLAMLRGLKKSVDPKNIFANGNLVQVEDEKDK